jgi:hypothetical protein
MNSFLQDVRYAARKLLKATASGAANMVPIRTSSARAFDLMAIFTRSSASCLLDSATQEEL